MKRGLILILLLMAGPVNAHKASDSYLSLSVNENQIQGQWDIALRDLDDAIGIDSNGDGAITWGELRERHRRITAYVLPRISVKSRGALCRMKMNDLMVDNHTDGGYAVLPFTSICPGASHSLDLDYHLFFDLDPTHRGLLSLEYNGHIRTAIFSPEKTRWTFDLLRPSHTEPLSVFFREGVWHLLSGFDHILFLILLLLPSVLQRTGQGWTPVKNFSSAFLDLLKIVTSFTVAHSVTLTLAVLGWVTLSSRWVESAIAASIIVAALNNLWPFLNKRRFWVAFGFGLLHGFGFAGVLTDLGLPRGALLFSLLGFNLGLEVAQVAIVTAFIPLAFYFRTFLFYQRVVLRVGSAMVMILASFWMIERLWMQ